MYNWQYVHSIYLWCTVLCLTHPSQELQPLIHPLVEVALGTLKLQSNCSRYWPLVLRISDMLTQLTEATGTHIPVLALLVQVHKYSVLQ